MVADVQAHYVTPERNAATLVALVPFDNAIVRGAVTALRWLSPQLVQFTQAVPSLDAAVDEALRVLEANGTPFRGDCRRCVTRSVYAAGPDAFVGDQLRLDRIR